MLRSQVVAFARCLFIGFALLNVDILDGEAGVLEGIQDEGAFVAIPAVRFLADFGD
ncbi:protein of unknown function [Candidatus Filomicrobium marinum]|uniref:Uncharacterized protein n=1 Tax=Candidatus Filomicrobium marinum TaxID=1608628 RepID=A0A0D6JAW9_9HYPH|nr:protein of unknown function [Candidatus Filomicrobium marinum]